MANVAIKENCLVFGGVSYFRAHAEEVEIGSMGEKRTPITKPNYLEVKDRIAFPKKCVAESTIVGIDFAKSSKTALNAAVSTVAKGDPVKIDAEGAYNKLKKGELKLVKLSISNNDMKKAANSSPEKIQDLIRWGSRARIAHQAFFVMENKLAERFTKKGKANLSISAKGLVAKAGIGGSSSSSMSITISKGTCFAYLLLKIKWDAKAKKERTRIVDLDDDQYGSS